MFSESHWSFTPPSASASPNVQDTRWVQSPIDTFVLARLEAARLEPAPPADKATLLRRVTFDLIGLPPTPAELDDFISDETPEAFARVVNRLLASPHYGERWGRHWLDVARYADSNGQDENKAMANAWRYRDYVIRAFNEDKPFDQFIREQLAGDLLPDVADERITFERRIATGFLVLGPKMLAEQDKPKLVMDVVDEQIDVVSRAFLGLTVSCSRCHDHKFDPIPTRDYYALAGIFKSTKTMSDLAFVSKWNERSVATREERERHEAHVKRTNEVEKLLATAVRDANAAVRAQWRSLAAGYLDAARASVDGAVSNRRGPTEVTHSTRSRDAGLHGPTLERWINHVSGSRSNGTPSPLAPFLSSSVGASTEFAAVVARLDGTAEQSRRPPTAPRFLPGRLGPGLRCGGDNYVEHPHAPELEPAELTVEAWARLEEPPRDGDSRRWLVNKNANEWAEGHYALILDGRRAGAYLNIGGGRENVFAVWSDRGPIPLKKWVHLAFTYNGTNLSLFVDGHAAGAATVGRARVPGDGPLHLGRRQDGYNYFKGGLDEVVIYRRALTAKEVRGRFDRPGVAPVDDVIRHWSFEPATDAERQSMADEALREVLFGAEGLLTPPAEARPFYSPSHAEVVARLEAERTQLATNAPPTPPVALAVEDDAPVDLPVYLRGSHLSPTKEPVPRGFLPVLHRIDTSEGAATSATFATSEASAAPPIPAGHSGRLELAEWLTDPAHPLTARVTVNRIWQAHFGEGLVRTPDNFGLRGEPPTHPELLDWLALEFIRNGWSVKRLHRLLLLSSTYQMSTQFDARAAQVDPENRLLWRMNRRRLEAEPLRDALLAVAGRLDRTMGGSLVNWRNAEYTPDDSVSAMSRRRAVYLPVVRDRVYDVFTIFDFANPSVGVSQRTPTVVAHQALFFLNSPFVKEQARHFAMSLLAAPGDDETRLEAAYRHALGRSPASTELAQAVRFLAKLRGGHQTRPTDSPDGDAGDWAALCQALFASNEFLYVN